LLVVILALGLAFIACDNGTGKDTGGSSAPETYEPLVIRGKDGNNQVIEIEFRPGISIP